MEVPQVSLSSTTRSHSKSLLLWFVYIFQIAEAAHMIRNAVKNTVCNFGLSRKFTRHLDSKYDYISMWAFSFCIKVPTSPLKLLSFPPHSTPTLWKDLPTQLISGLIYINEIKCNFSRKSLNICNKETCGIIKGIDHF